MVENARQVTLPASSLVLFGGGWKSFSGQRIPRNDLVALITQALGLAPDRIVEGYSMTEMNAFNVRCDYRPLPPAAPVGTRAAGRRAESRCPPNPAMRLCTGVFEFLNSLPLILALSAASSLPVKRGGAGGRCLCLRA